MSAVGLFTRWLHRWGLLLGWALAMVYGTIDAYRQHSATVGHFAGSPAPVPWIGVTASIGLTALVINLVVAVVVTAVLRIVARSPAGRDETSPSDYVVDAEDVPPSSDVRRPAFRD